MFGTLPMKTIKQIIIALTAIMLAGCVSENLPPPPPKSDPAMTKIAESAAAVSDSLTTLEGIRKSERPAYKKKLPDPNDFGMTFMGSVDYTGPIGPIVYKLATNSRYKLHVMGNPPAIPIIVQLYKKNVPLAMILRDADYQAGDKADIVVNNKTRTIELRYKV